MSKYIANIQLPNKKHTCRIMRIRDDTKSTPKKEAFEYWVDLFPPGAEIPVRTYTHIPGKGLFQNDIRLVSMRMSTSLAKRILAGLE